MTERGYPKAAGGETCRQRNGLANGCTGAHIRGMEKYRSRMLEVTVTNHSPKWQWEVSSGGEMIANGFEGEQIAARFEGYNAMFLLLAGGWKS
jgi:hypothetical protein